MVCSTCGASPVWVADDALGDVCQPRTGIRDGSAIPALVGHRSDAPLHQVRPVTVESATLAISVSQVVHHISEAEAEVIIRERREAGRTDLLWACESRSEGIVLRPTLL